MATRNRQLLGLVAISAGLFFLVQMVKGETELVKYYRQRIAAATTASELEDIRFGSPGFEPDYGAGRLTRAEYERLFNAYVARYVELGL